MKKNTRGLGKGLGALLSESEQAIVETQASSAVLMDVDIDQIVPNPNQARKVFDEEGLKALAASIRLYGVVQPILLRKLPEGEYMLIAGGAALACSAHCRAFQNAGDSMRAGRSSANGDFSDRKFAAAKFESN